MAKLTAPLFSLEARGSIAKSLVYFPWKGINAARQYVTPANPNTAPQQTQRGYVTTIVALIHACQGLAADPLTAVDNTAYSIYSRTLGATMTWFNALVRQSLLQKVAALRYAVYRDGTFTPGAGQVICHLEWTKETAGANNITGGNWFHGNSPTALNTSVAATIVADSIDNTIVGLASGVKTYFQFRATLHADFVGTRSGIYSATPT